MEALALMTINNAAVVQNDKPNAATTAQPVAAKKAANLSEMEAKRQQWEPTAYRTSNQQLYAVLADCFGPILDGASRGGRTHKMCSWSGTPGHEKPPGR